MKPDRDHNRRGDQSCRNAKARAESHKKPLNRRRWLFERQVLVSVREPLPLTDREREIVMLLREGLSNRDVATRLTLSVRTVEGHIYKAITETGTASSSWH